MSMELENIFLYYLIRALQFVQLDIWQIFLTELLNNMWMATPSGIPSSSLIILFL